MDNVTIETKTPGEGNYYAYFDIPPALNLDLEDLEKRYYRLSRQYHPDFFQNWPEEEQQEALEKSAALNKAYDTLRGSIRRIEYMMQLHGFESETDKNAVAQELMMEIFELQELLEEFQGADEDEREILATQIRTSVDEMKQRREEELDRLPVLCREFDSSQEQEKIPLLEKMRQTIDRSNYFRRIIENSEKTIAGEADSVGKQL